MAAFTDEQIAFMRADLENDMALSKLINVVKENLRKEGKNFDEEFDNWKKQNNRV